MTNTTGHRSVMWLPNAITIFRILAGVLLFIVIFYDKKITGLRIACFTLIAVTDWVDGWLARRMNAHTVWGQLLDPLADKVVLLFAFAYFRTTGNVSVWFTVLYFVREVLQTGIRIFSFVNKKSTQTPTLLISKIKTALSYLYGLLLFFEQVCPVVTVALWRQIIHAGFEWLIIILSFAGFLKSFIHKWNLNVGKN